MDNFTEHALKPVLWEQAKQQAAQRRRQDKRSTAKGREGEPLSTDVEELYVILNQWDIRVPVDDGEPWHFCLPITWMLLRLLRNSNDAP